MIKKIFLSILSFLIFVPITIFAWLTFGPGGVYSGIDHGTDKVLIIEKGSSHQDILALLLDKKLIQNKYVYYAALLIAQQYGKLKAGEFLIPQHSRPCDIIKILCCGRVIVHNVTFPEGITVSEVVSHLNQLDNLKGEISSVPEEGMVLPETYTYIYGDSRQSILNRMETAMIKLVNDLWERRSELDIYSEPRQAIVMASIIEKETAKACERPRVAGVFVNRLKKGMKLQSDPTVVYGLTLGKSSLGRPLTKQDLLSPTIYNTYMIKGLPPSPIACPGEESLKAALNPLKTEDLFFVANGSGGHAFSRTYAQHSNHVQTWRAMERRR